MFAVIFLGLLLAVGATLGLIGLMLLKVAFNTPSAPEQRK